MSKEAVVGVVLLFLAGLAGWLLFLNCMRTGKAPSPNTNTSAENGPPPPGPIIDIDPKQSAGSVFKPDGQIATCETPVLGKLNKWWIGSIQKFDVTVNGRAGRVKKVSMNLVYTDQNNNTTTKPLIIEEASSGFNFIYDGTVLNPHDYGNNSKRKLRTDFCQAAIENQKFPTMTYLDVQSGQEHTVTDVDYKVTVQANVPN